MNEAQPPSWTQLRTTDDSASAVWTPREYVWLLMLASKSGRSELVDQIRARIRELDR
jgi:hypothetical protein